MSRTFSATGITRKLIGPILVAVFAVVGFLPFILSHVIVRIAGSAADTQSIRLAIGTLELLCGALAGVSAGALAMAFVLFQRAILRPFGSLAAQARERIRTGDPRPLRTSSRITEVRDFAEIFNGLYARQDSRVREFDGLVHLLAHNLSAPLSVLGTLATELRSGRTTPEDAATVVEESTRRISGMLRLYVSLFDNYSRINGAPAVPTDIRKIVSDIASDYASEAKEAGVRLVINDDGTPLVRYCHESKLAAILDNLVGNAIKYTEPGGTVTITASTVPSSPSTTGAGALVLTVTDTGIGIPEEDLERIFEPEFRCAAAKDRPGQGHGLALVRSLVAYYGGTIAATPNNPKGTAFSATLPLPDHKEKTHQ